MNIASNKALSRLARLRFFSPSGFLVCALLITVTFAGLEALGLRSSISVLTDASPLAGGWPALGTSCLYLLCYLAFVGLVPILVLGSIFLLLLNLIISLSYSKNESLPEHG